MSTHPEDLRDPEAREVDPTDLDGPDTAENLVEEALAGQRPPAHPVSAEDYRPGTPRPDLEGAADEADVAEQAEEVPELADDDAYGVDDEPDGVDVPDEDVED